MENILWLAVVFFCIGDNCHVLSIDQPFEQKSVCEEKIFDMEDKLKNTPNVTKIEIRCLDIKYGIKT
jgi:hypothetical protein